MYVIDLALMLMYIVVCIANSMYEAQYYEVCFDIGCVETFLFVQMLL